MKKFASLLRLSMIAVLLANAFLQPQTAQAAVAAGNAQYFIPAPADQVMPILDNIETSYVWNDGATGDNTLTNVITIAVATDNTRIYFDHWEDGYGTDATGNNEIYVANEGAVLTFKSTNIPYPRGATLAACTASTFPVAGGRITSASGGNATYCYDGGDRVYVAGGIVSVAQAFWPSEAQSNFANAWEVYPTKPYQTTYSIPVGEDMYVAAPSTYADFDNVYVMVQATQNNTNVQIDDPETAGVEVNTTINKGVTTRLDHIWKGTTITASSPVQVQFIVGEDLVVPGQSNSKSYTAVPSSLWASSYYAPVSGDQAGVGAAGFQGPYRTDLFIYNPTASPLTINWQDSSGNGSFVIAAGATEAYSDAGNAGHTIPYNSAAYIAAADGATKFWAVGSSDSGDPTWNWGFTLIPPQTLTNEYYVSWAPGNSNVPPNVAGGLGNPIWVTPVNNDTTFFVDYSPTNDTVDLTFTLDRIQMRKVMDPDADNTAMHIWATGPFAISWGEDTDTAQAASPGLDAGYTILPLNKDWVDVVLDLDKVASPTSISNAANEVVTFTLNIDVGLYGMNDITVTDVLPANWQYVNNSTNITWSDGVDSGSSIANPTITGTAPGPYTLNWGNVADLGVNGVMTVTYQARTTAAPGSYSQNNAEVTGTTGGETYTASDYVIIVATSADLSVTKTNNVVGNALVGSAFTWSLQVVNGASSGKADFTDQVILRDNLPAGPAYGSVTVTNGPTPPTGTGTISCSITANVLTCTANGAVTLPTDSSFTVSFPVTPAAAGTLTNPVAGAGNVCQVDPNTLIIESDEANNTCSNTVTVVASSMTMAKTASRGGSPLPNGTLVNPGDTIQYTVTVTNTGGTDQNNIVVYDAVPAGTHRPLPLVAPQITGLKRTGTISEPFAAQNYTGNQDSNNNTTDPSWVTANWVELNEAAQNATANDVQVLDDAVKAGVYELRIGGQNNGLYRDIDISACTNAYLNLSYRRQNLDNANDYVQLGIGINGAITTANLAQYGSTGAAVTDATYQSARVDISGYLDDNTRIQLLSSNNANMLAADYVWFDDISIDCYVSGTYSGGAPADIALGSDGYLIRPTGTMTVTYTVGVDDPVLNGRTSIVNTAYVSSNEQPAQLTSTTTHPLPVIDVSLDKQVSSATPSVGSNVTFTLVVANAGPNTATNVAVTDIIPSGYTYVASSITGGDSRTDTSPAGTGLTWTINSLASGASVNLTYQATVLASGAYDNYAEITGHSQTDSDSTRNNGQQTTDEDDDDTVTVTPVSAGTLVIVKDSVPNNTQDFAYTVSGTGLAPFSLDDDADGTLSNTQTFNSLAAGGTYTVTETAVAGWSVTNIVCTGATSSTVTIGAAGGFDTGDTAVSVVLAVGETVTCTFENTQLGTISGQVRYDVNNDGNPADADSGLAGASVALFTDPNGDGNPADGVQVGGTVTTTGTGSYTFTNVVPGNYVVVETNPAGYTSTYDLDGTTNNTLDQIEVTLTAGGNSTGNDFLDTTSFSISGQVRYDVDNDGDLGDVDSGLAGAGIALYTDPNGDGDPSDGVQVGTTVTTTGTGNYAFNNLIPGNYVVVETNPSGYTSTADSSAPNNDRVPVVITNANSTGNIFLDTTLFSISGQVRYDVDNNGNLADADGGLAGADVALFTDPNGDGDPSDGVQVGGVVTTTGTGNYSFTNLLPGNYVVVETNPAGYTSTADSSAPNNDRVPVVITNANSTGNDFLDTSLFSVSGQVRNDIDNDGNLADAEAGLAGADVALFTDPNGDGDPSDGVQVGSTITTTGTGNYTFSNLTPGNYVVVETNPSGYTSTADTSAPNNDRVPVVITNANSANNDFLDTNVGTISGQVRYDVDNNGNPVDADSGITTVTVSLYTDPNGDGDPSDGALVTTTTTNGAGNYTFSNVVPGNYVVVETNSGGYTSTYDLDGTTNNTLDQIEVTLTPGSNNTGNDFLDTILFSVSGQVRNDIDNDGNLADTEAGLAGADVALFTDPNGDGDPSDGVQVGATITTTGTGNYTFNNLIPGNYVVVETNPAGYTSTADSSAPNNDRVPVVITNANSTGNDFLDTNVGSISGQVRLDSDNDGNSADPDGGLAGAGVALYTDPNGDGDPSDGVQVGVTITTTGTGNYTFPNVVPGNYVVVETNPAGYLSTYDLDGTANNTFDQIEVTLSAGGNSTGNDFLDTVVYSISGQVRYDVDNDGNLADSDAGLAGADVALFTDPNGDGDPADGVQVGATITTTGTGNYTFTTVVPGNYVVVETNPAGYTSTADSSAPNNDRVSVVVTNANSTGNDFLDTTFFSINGQVRYDVDNDGNLADSDGGLAGADVALFTDPNGDGDPADGVQVGATITTTGTGNYSFTNLIPGNYVVVETNPVGYTSTADSSAPNNDRVPVVITNANSTGNDFLDTNVGTISGQVRYDTDNDGNPADLDAGITTVTVSLYTDPNGDGDPSDGALVTSTTTNGAGNYTFTNVVPGNYVVIETNLAGYTSTYDSDGATNNTLDQIEVTLSAGGNSTGNDFLDTFLYSISGQIRYDVDNDGNLADADAGLAGADVALFTDPNGDGDPSDGTQVGASVTTTGTGNYTFNNLAPGNYVVVETNPAGYISTADSSAPNNDRVPVVITNANSTGNNFLDTILFTVSGQVRYDVDNDGNLADSDSGLAGADVALFTDPNGDGDPADGVQVGATVTTTGTGNYTFNNLIPGNYVVVETNPAGYTSTADSSAPNNDRVPVVVTNADSTDNDFLDTNVGNISGQVRYDVDNNGNPVDADSGLTGADVALFTDPNGDGDPSDGAQVGATVTTTGTGNYTFTNVVPGNYVVVETNPAGYTSTYDVDGTTNNTLDQIEVTLASSGNSTGNDFLDTLLFSVSGQVRYDVDNDGNLADSDSGLAGADVALFTDPNGDGDPADGVQVGATVTTTGTGNYTFNNLIPGNYVVVETNPAGYTSTADSSTPNNDRVPVVITNANSTDNDFLDTILFSVSGQVRYDVDNDGSLADADSGLAGADIAIFTDPNGDGDPSDGVQVGATVTTTGTGNYTFNNLIPGNYVVVETNPAGYTSTADSSAPNNDRVPVVITNADSTNNDFLDTNVGSISGQVRYDVDNNGNPVDADGGLAGADVVLFTDPNGDGDPSDGVQVGATVTTTGTGNYTFTNVVPGNYVVVETNPAGYASTYDLDGTTSNTLDQIEVSLAAGGNNTGNDFLDTVLYSISGQVRYDVDNDGNLADTDAGLTGADVALFTDPNGDGDPADGVQVGATITTTGTGNYTFNNLIPGNYVVVETNPAGYTSTADSVTPNNDRVPVVITNANSTDNDFLDTIVYSVSGQVRHDVDNDGDLSDADAGLAGANVAIFTDPNGDGNPADGVQVGATVTTTGTGNYTFNNLIPGNYVVVETNPAGYTSTADSSAPNNDRVPVVITNTNSTGNDFLDAIPLLFSDLELDKSVSNTAPLVTTNIDFTVTVTNDGPDGATNVVVTDVLPAGFTHVSDSATQGNYDELTGIWTVGALALNQTETLTITVAVNIIGPYTNYAEITGVDQGDTDSTPSNSSTNEDDDDSVTVTPTQNTPSLGKSVSGSNQTFTAGTDVAIGEIVEYTVNVNVPPGIFNNTQMVDTMDRGLSFMDCVSITGTGVTTSVGSLTTVCDNAVSDNPGTTTVDDGRRVTFDLGTLTNSSGSDQTLSFVYTAVVLDNADNVSGLTLNNSAQLILGSNPTTPANATVDIVEPDLSISKTANTTLVAVGSEVTITLDIQHTTNSETNAYDVLVVDTLPAELELVTGTLECASGAQDATTCSYDTGTRTVRAIWNSFALGGGNGRVTFRVRIMSLPPGGVSNTANVAWTSLPGDVSTPQNSNAFSTERDYDPASQVDVYGTSDTLVLGVFNGAVPATGFAPNVVTDLSKVKRESYSQAENMTVEIPALGVSLPIVGVSLKNGEWNVAWLGNQAGWLEGSAFPTWSGNSVLTGHVYGANGLPGPFVKLNTLKYGDKIVIHAYGKKYVYEVRVNKVVSPNDASIFNHETKSWLTLVTCKEYDEATNTYKKRVVVRAVLVSVE